MMSFSIANLRQGLFLDHKMMGFFLPGASIFPQEKKWYFSVILLSNVNLDHVILYVCCVFQLIVAVIYHLQSFGTQNPAYDLFLKGADVNACSETFNNSFELTMGLTGRGFPGWNFTYIPWIANRADPSTCFFQVMKVVNLKERLSKSPQKAQTQAKWLCIFCCRLFYQFHIQ